jgi:oxygen-independent coproporphyrinogen-3 oxidase
MMKPEILKKKRNNPGKEPRKRSMMGFPSEAVEDIQAAWLTSTAKPEKGSRTLYIHIPFCRSRCLFCPFYMGRADKSEISDYAETLAKEIRNTFSNKELASQPVNAIYFGGGTPSDLSAKDIDTIMSAIRTSCSLTNDCEITMEGRVAGFSDDSIKACVENGINRFSIGVQTFNTKIRQSLGRVAEKKKVIEFLNKLISLNQASVVIDLLYGLPGQTMDDWIEDQLIVLKEAPISGLDHYKLNTHPGLPLAECIQKGKLPPCPSEEESYEMYKEGEMIMNDSGAVRLSIKHYALEYRERNANNDIAGRKSMCIPFGVHAGGRIKDLAFRQTDNLKLYKDMALSGLKPLSYAGKLPRDHGVNNALAGQISRQRGINLPLACKSDAEMLPAIMKTCAPLLNEWQEKELIHPGRMGWQRLSSRAMFLHKRLAPELMEKVAEAYEK